MYQMLNLVKKEKILFSCISKISFIKFCQFIDIQEFYH